MSSATASVGRSQWTRIFEYKKTTDEQARAAIKSGDIAAYIVIPEEFVSEAFNGKLIPIQFVSRREMV